MNDKIENGVEVMGINIDITQILGQKIIDQYIAQLTDENIKEIFSYISSDLFCETSVFNSETSECVKILKVKERKKDQWGYKDKEIPIGEVIKKHFNERIKEELKKKVEEIIASADYQDKVNEIANELVDYSINGYKEDMKDRIRERLVGNVTDALPYYCGKPLSMIVNELIDKRLI